MKIGVDPGHGMSNSIRGKLDTGAVWSRGAERVTEEEIVMEWANELRGVLLRRGHEVVRTRVNRLDPAPVGRRAGIARQFGCDVLISLHCNAANGRASGTETFYRGTLNKPLAVACNEALVSALGTRDRGVKLESQSQHKRLAVLAFPRAVLIELGFIDNATDRALLRDEAKMLLACQALADAITETYSPLP
jgi:N-acetylmuramoyl-L-alanine amidase